MFCTHVYHLLEKSICACTLIKTLKSAIPLPKAPAATRDWQQGLKSAAARCTMASMSFGVTKSASLPFAQRLVTVGTPSAITGTPSVFCESGGAAGNSPSEQIPVLFVFLPIVLRFWAWMQLSGYQLAYCLLQKNRQKNIGLCRFRFSATVHTKKRHPKVSILGAFKGNVLCASPAR